MAVRVDISAYLENILSAVYGEEVRGSIHDAIEALHDEVESDVTVVTDTFDYTTPAGYAADAKAIHEQAMLIRGKLANDDPQAGLIDLNTIYTSGVYRLVASETYQHSPLTSTTGWLVVYQYGDGGRNCMQICYETGTSDRRTYGSYFRTYSASAGWGEWQSGVYSLDDTLTLPGYAADAKAVGDKIAELAYSPIEFTALNYTAYTEDSVTASDGAPLEKGQVVTSVAYQWILNKDPVWVRLDGSDLPIDNVHPWQNQGRISSISVSSNKTWTFKAKEAATGSIDPVTASYGVSVIFYPRVFWGAAPDELNPGSAFIESFRATGSLPVGSLDVTFTATAATGNYIWFASPVSYGVPVFTYNGFNGGFKLIKEVTFTNKYSVTEQYYIYRSVQPSLGTVEITVSKA